MPMNRIKRIVKYFIVKFKYRNKVSFDFSCNISVSSSFEGMSKIHRGAVFKGSLGYGSYIGDHSKLVAQIGRFTSIGPRVSNNLGVHPYKEPFVSTAPCFYSLNKNKTQNGSTFATEQTFTEWSGGGKGTIIGNDCWIGEGAFLVGNIKINDGAIVLAHAVVTKDVPPYAIVGGVPAKVISYRYDQDTIEFLMSTEWWNNSPLWFKENWKLLNDMNRFKDYFKSL